MSETNKLDLNWIKNPRVKQSPNDDRKPKTINEDKIEKQRVKQKKSTHAKKSIGKSNTKRKLPFRDDEIQKLIEKKINDLLPAALLNLVKIGYKHELSLENMKQYFKETGQAKLYNLIRYFSDTKPREVEEMLDYLYQNNYLIKTSNRWYKLNPEERD